MVSTIESPKIAIEYDDFSGRVVVVGLGEDVNSGVDDKIADVATAFTDSSSRLEKLIIYRNPRNVNESKIMTRINIFLIMIIIPF